MKIKFITMIFCLVLAVALPLTFAINWTQVSKETASKTITAAKPVNQIANPTITSAKPIKPISNPTITDAKTDKTVKTAKTTISAADITKIKSSFTKFNKKMKAAKDAATMKNTDASRAEPQTVLDSLFSSMEKFLNNVLNPSGKNNAGST